MIRADHCLAYSWMTCGLWLGLIGVGLGGEACAQTTVQGVPNAMQGFSQNRDEPIQIEAAVLEMRDKKKQATFSGDVKVVQGDTTMTSKVLVVFYDSAGSAAPTGSGPAGSAPPARSVPAADSPPPTAAKPSAASATPGPSGSSSIRKLEATGKVKVTQKDQVVTGEKAVFDTKTNLITMLGDVVLTQGMSVLRGDRLLVDMTTGVSRVESENGRIQGTFQSAGQGGGAPIPGTAAPSAPGSRPK